MQEKDAVSPSAALAAPRFGGSRVGDGRGSGAHWVTARARARGPWARWAGGPRTWTRAPFLEPASEVAGKVCGAAQSRQSPERRAGRPRSPPRHPASPLVAAFAPSRSVPLCCSSFSHRFARGVYYRVKRGWSHLSFIRCEYFSQFVVCLSVPFWWFCFVVSACELMPREALSCPGLGEVFCFPLTLLWFSLRDYV